MTPHAVLDVDPSALPAVDALVDTLVEKALRAHRGNQSRAAKALGLSRFGLQKKLKRLGIPSRDPSARLRLVK